MTGPAVAFLVTLLVGTARYMLIKGWSLSTAGRLFTIGLIGAGVMLAWYTMSLFVSTVVEGSVRQR